MVIIISVLLIVSPIRHLNVENVCNMAPFWVYRSFTIGTHKQTNYAATSFLRQEAYFSFDFLLVYFVTVVH